MIDAIGIADEGVGDSAEIQEAIPVGIVAREPRDFEAEYNADMAESDFGSKSGKAIARHDTGSGNAKIFVDNDNLLRRPSKCGCFGGQRILALRRLDCARLERVWIAADRCRQRGKDAKRRSLRDHSSVISVCSAALTTCVIKLARALRA